MAKKVVVAGGSVAFIYSDPAFAALRGLGESKIRRISNVEFNHQTGKWEVLGLDGALLHEDPSRDEAIRWEVRHFEERLAQLAEATT